MTKEFSSDSALHFKINLSLNIKQFTPLHMALFSKKYWNKYILFTRTCVPSVPYRAATGICMIETAT